MAQNDVLIRNLRTQGEALLCANRLHEARDLYISSIDSAY